MFIIDMLLRFRSGKVNPDFPYMLHLGIQVLSNQFLFAFLFLLS